MKFFFIFFDNIFQFALSFEKEILQFGSFLFSDCVDGIGSLGILIHEQTFEIPIFDMI